MTQNRHTRGALASIAAKMGVILVADGLLEGRPGGPMLAVLHMGRPILVPEFAFDGRQVNSGRHAVADDGAAGHGDVANE